MADASLASSRPPIDVSPDTLSFELFPNSQPGCILSVGNASEVSIAFKVKTTEPRRYLVRPNQGMVGPGESESVNVYLIEKECNQLLREGIQTPSSLGKVADKFLVQTVGLGDRESALLTSVTAAKQSEALTKIWATFDKTVIRNKKLGVKISLANGAAAAATAAAAGASQTKVNTTAGGVQSPARPDGTPVTSPGSRTSTTGVAAAGGAYGARNGGRGGVSRGAGGGDGVGGGGLDENSRVLANKYDDLVNYTANLTEERDELNTSLEEAKKSLQREMATRIALESRGQMPQGRKGSTRSGVRPPVNHQRGGGGGFGLFTLSLVAASFFFLGHWLDLASAGGGGGRPAAVAGSQQKPTGTLYDATVSKPAPLQDRAESAPRPISGGESGGGSEL